MNRRVREMSDRDAAMKAVFLGSYPPRNDGIAIFVQNMVRQFSQTGVIVPHVVSVSEKGGQHPQEVLAVIEQGRRSSHLAAAEEINACDADVLLLQHDFGLYGGTHGEYLLDLLERVDLPYYVTCHNVPLRPDDAQREVLANVCYYSEAVVALCQTSKRLLEDVYGVAPEKIRVIHYGAAMPTMAKRENLKQAYGVAGKTIVSTIGNIAPKLGLEYGIQAVAQLAKKYPQIYYVIAGSTHQELKRMQREEYRAGLLEMVKRMGLEENIRFVNRQLTREERMNLLTASDMCLMPYLSFGTFAHATLANAMGCGRVVVATPSLYAQEMLAEGRGLTARFGDAASLARCMETVLESPQMQSKMEENARLLGQDIAWGKVCDQYENLLLQQEIYSFPS